MPEPQFDLRSDHRAIVLDILQRHLPDREVWAFGSRATGHAKPHSDLDLALIGNEPFGFDVMARLTEAFSESDLPWRVDLLDWATTGEAFRRIVERDKVVLQAGPSPTSPPAPAASTP